MSDRTNPAARHCGYSDRPGAPADASVCPAAAQTGDEISAWLSDHGAPGAAVVVLFRQQELCQFRLDEIAAWRGRRVHLVEHGPFDSRGFSIGSPRSACLRILKPTAAVLDSALRGATLQHCRLVNERELSAREQALAQQVRRGE